MEVPGFSVHTEKCPYDNTVRSWPPDSQGQRTHEKLNLPISLELELIASRTGRKQI